MSGIPTIKPHKSGRRGGGTRLLNHINRGGGVGAPVDLHYYDVLHT